MGGAGGWGGWNKPRCWREKALRGVNQNFSSYCFKPFKMIQCCPFYLLHWPLTQNTLVCARPHQKHINGMLTTLMRYSLEALLVSIDNPQAYYTPHTSQTPPSLSQQPRANQLTRGDFGRRGRPTTSWQIGARGAGILNLHLCKYLTPRNNQNKWALL